jgi:Carboxypeptidase regulatory-like domain
MSMKRLSIALSLAAGLAAAFAACDDRGPIAPSRLPPASSEPAIYSLGGLVTEPVDVGVDGATVTVMDGSAQGVSSITEGGGRYSLSGVGGTFTVQVTKDGYTSSTKQVTVPQATSLHFEIAPLAPHANVSGAWTVTFEPHRTCPDLTRSDVMKYRASIVQQGALLEVALSGATFLTPPQLAGTIRGGNISIALPQGCDFYCYYGPPLPSAVTEILGGNQFLAISGQITATASRSSIAGTLNGQFALMRSATAPFNVFASCSNENHRVTFTRELTEGNGLLGVDLGLGS